MLEITKREIIFSIIIIAIMVTLGVLIGGKINDSHNDKVAMYNTALKITETDIFKYGMKTGVGNSFVKGTLQAVSPVTYPELDGDKKYMYVEKVKEKYTMHTRTVTTTDSNGNSHTTTEVYWTWDYAGSESLQCKSLNFLNVNFKTKKFDIPSASYIETIYDGIFSDVRYVYYGANNKYDCIIFTNLKNNTINNTDYYYNDGTINELILSLESNFGIVVFWIFWILLTAGLVFLFYFAENRWLD